MKYLKLYEFFNDNHEIPKSGDYIIITAIEEYYIGTEIVIFLKSHIGKVIKMNDSQTCKIKYDKNHIGNEISDGYYYIQLSRIKYILFETKEESDEYLEVKKYNL